ncbi:hypothetical protein [Niveispirillum irakense]|uniref:hypothetical protein n=1 Tax=Niveispirillum irakense TaxID=34011 RepID=UPI00040CB238|nr:hypothetical protein [Niveispirillum irakense]
MDLLVKLYDLPLPLPMPAGIIVRRALAPEAPLILAWVEERFGPGWRAECQVALSACPTRLHIAIGEQDGRLLGFACHDATGPRPVRPHGRG